MSDLLQEAAGVDLSRTIGQALIGTFIATAFWGITCMQTAFYFATYGSDRWQLKILVIVLLLLDTAHEVICIDALWQTLIPRFGNLTHITSLHPDFMWQATVGSIVAFTSRSFFTWRIWIFSNKKWIFPVVLIPPCVGGVVGTFIWAVKGAGKPASYIASPSVSRFFLAVSVIIASTDITIAVMMCVLLWRGRTGHLATDRMILHLMTASVYTGCWTAILGIFCVITTVGWPHALYSLLGQLPLCTLYCNAVLLNLNSRKFIGNKHIPIDTISGLPSNDYSIRFGSTLRSTSETGPGNAKGVRNPDDKSVNNSVKPLAIQITTSRTLGSE